MSNTLKFGDGKWAVKEGSTLAYNDENGNFKPLPFTFDRSTSATRVNKQGLIEVVPNNEPRIDFLNDSNGSLLLEPSRSNELTYSNSGNFSLIRCTRNIQSNKLGIVNGYEYSNTTSTPNININYSETTLGYKTFSLFIDATNSDYFNIRLATGGGANFGAEVTFTPSTKSFSSISQNSTYVRNSSVGYEYFGDNIYRIWITTEYILYLGTTFAIVYFGNNTNVWMGGFQIEQGSYATSYIPTQGSIGTRVADSCSQTVPDGIIGQTEGTVLVEFVNKINYESGGYNMLFTIYENSSSLLYVAKRNPTGIEIETGSGSGAYIYLPSGIFDVEGKTYKMAIGYKENDFVVYVDGIEIWSYNSGTIVFSNASNLSLGSYYNQTLNFNSKINNFKLYNTRLSNTELQALTKI